jgi:ketosteroid isomerase-like protein
MKKIFFIFILFNFFSLFLLSSTSDENNQSVKDVNRVLDLFHKAASNADEAGYLGCMDDDAIFLGTDGNELWTKKEFALFVKPYFSKGIGWTYIPRERSVHISCENKFAWFSEKLYNDKYGELRGSGVLRKNKSGWKIVQYNMVFVIPNSCSKSVVCLIKGSSSGKTANGYK